jgi:hypothetical protein
MPEHARTEIAPRRGHRMLVVAVLCAAVLLAAGTSAVGAQDGPGDVPEPGPGGGWAVQPSSPDGPGGRDWFFFTLSPGQVFGDMVGISNLSDRPIRFGIFVRDAFNASGSGAFSAQQEDEQPRGAGTWIELAASEYTVEPGMRVDLPFRIEIPDDAPPGDHAAAILAVDMDDPGFAQDLEQSGVSVRTRVGARVYVRVAGPLVPALRIDRIHVAYDNPIVPFIAGGGSATVEWQVTNTGNQRIDADAQLRITGLLGRTVKRLEPVDVPELLPGGSYTHVQAVGGLPPFERLSADVTVTSREVEVRRAAAFWAVPWLLLALLLLGGGLWWWRRHRQRRKPSSGESGSPPPVHRKEPVPV